MYFVLLLLCLFNVSIRDAKNSTQRQVRSFGCRFAVASGNICGVESVYDVRVDKDGCGKTRGKLLHVEENRGEAKHPSLNF